MPESGLVSVKGFAMTYDAGTVIELHCHAEHQIVHAMTGVMRVHVRDAVWVLPPGRGLWVPARVPHEIRCTNAIEMRTVYLDGEHPSMRRIVEVIRVSPLMREVMIRLAEGCGEEQEPHLVALLLGEIAGSDAEPLRLPVPADERISRLVSHLAANPADDTPLPVRARQLGFSQRSLIRHVRRETGLSFRELKRQVRVMAAVEQLAANRSVTEVALAVGFDSPSAFTHAFREVTGKAPRDYFSETTRSRS